MSQFFLRSFRTAALALIFAPSLLLAQVDPQAEAKTAKAPQVRPTGGFDRIFLGFIEDAIIAERQWWEGQGEWSESDAVDAWIIRGIVAVQPWDNVELGGRIGFGDTDTPSPLPNGNGATDLDAWGKYLIPGQNENLDLAVGALVTVPTGDDTVGLGYDAFGLGFFGSGRYRLDRFTLSGNVGFRINGDGMTLGGPELNGKTSPRLGAAIIFPLADAFDLVGEASYEGERFEDTDDDIRFAAGANWRLGQRNLLRGAVVFGASDGAPDSQFLLSYAVQFR